MDIEVGSYMILGYGIRVIKNILNREKRENTEHLILKNIIMVEKFYINIILEVLLRKVGIWYIEFDYSLRFREEHQNIIVKKLQKRYIIIFFKYKKFFIYQ